MSWIVLAAKLKSGGKKRHIWQVAIYSKIQGKSISYRYNIYYTIATCNCGPTRKFIDIYCVGYGWVRALKQLTPCARNAVRHGHPHEARFFVHRYWAGLWILIDAPIYLQYMMTMHKWKTIMMAVVMHAQQIMVYYSCKLLCEILVFGLMSF